MRTWQAALLMLALVHATEARADWSPTGQLGALANNSIRGVLNADIVLSPSGHVYLHATGKGGNQIGHSANRFRPTGDLSPGWPADGANLVAITGPEDYVGWTLDRDESIWFMVPGTPTVARIDSSGNRSPDFRLTTQTLSMTNLSLAPGPGGAGVYASFGFGRLQRLTPSGSVSPGWPANGISVGGSDWWLTPDGTGGVLMLDNFFSHLQRRDSTGLMHAGWPSGGRALTTYTGLLHADFSHTQLWLSGQHAIVTWGIQTSPSVIELRAQRIGLDGVLDPLWPADGVLVTAADSITTYRSFDDGAGGVYMTYMARGVPKAAHITSSGVVGTTSLVQSGDHYTPPTAPPTSTRPPRVPSTVTSDGRLAFAWDVDSLEGDIRVRFLLPDLSLDPAEPASGRLIPVAGDPNKHRVLDLGSDGDRGVFVAWEHFRPQQVCCPPFGEVYLTRLPATPIGAGVTPGRNALALSAPRPNPARGSATFELTLPDDSAAQLELLDLAGRVVQSRSVSGAGRHAITFDALERVSPGLYFVRARARSGVSTSRVVVSH